MTSNRTTLPPAFEERSHTDQHQDSPGGPETKATKLDLSLPQLLGGALAAMTAAALGSRLGVAGTITGAAVASVIAGVAGSLYTASLQQTREKLATVLVSRRDGRPQQSSGVKSEGLSLDSPRATSMRPPGRRLPWKPVLAATGATFVVALVVLTGLESLAGAALSGGHGTTVQQVTTPHQSNQRREDGPSPADKTKSPSPAPSTSSTLDAEPTETLAPSEAPSSPRQASKAPSRAAAKPTPTTQAPTPDVPATGKVAGH